MSTRLRYLYGVGGLSDLGGLGQIQPLLSIPLVMPSTQEEGQRLARAMVTASPDPDPTNPQQVTDQDAALCDCAINEAARVFRLTPDVVQQLNQACYREPAAFIPQLQQQAQSQGVALDMARCGASGAAAPWWKQPRTWVIGGGLAVGAAVVWSLLK